MDIFANSHYTEPRRSAMFRRVHGLTAPVKRYAQNQSSGSNGFLGLAWIVSSILTVLVPLVYRTIHKKNYRQEYMNYFWQEEYESYAQQRQENYEKYGNNYNYGGAYQAGDYSQSEYVDVNRCKWWNVNCFSFFVNGDGDAMPNQEWQPTWYSGFSKTEEERQEMEDSLEQPGSLKFVYVWQIVLFLALGYYGMLVIRQNRNPTGLIIGLLVWANFAFLTMWLMADGSIVTEGQSVKRTGFYGQMSVLIFMTNFWYCIHGLAFVLVFGIKTSNMAEQEAKERKEREAVQAKAEERYEAPGASTH